MCIMVVLSTALVLTFLLVDQVLLSVVGMNLRSHFARMSLPLTFSLSPLSLEGLLSLGVSLVVRMMNPSHVGFPSNAMVACHPHGSSIRQNLLELFNRGVVGHLVGLESLFLSEFFMYLASSASAASVKTARQGTSDDAPNEVSVNKTCGADSLRVASWPCSCPHLGPATRWLSCHRVFPAFVWHA